MGFTCAISGIVIIVDCLCSAYPCGGKHECLPYDSHLCNIERQYVFRHTRPSGFAPRKAWSSHSLRRHKLRISRACAFKNLFARALAHSAAPPLPKKSVGLFGDPLYITPCFLISPPRCIVHRTRFGGSTLRSRREPSLREPC